MSRLVAAVGLLLAAAGGFAKLAGGPTWLLLALGGVGLTVVAIQVLVVWRLGDAVADEAWRSLIDEPRPLSALTSADLYALGVEQEAEASLRLAGERGSSAAYRARDSETRLREDLSAALALDDATLILVTGNSKAGKSRLALEALAALGREGQACQLIVPRSQRPDTIAALADAGPPVGGPLVIWLDDVEPWTRPNGICPKTLAGLAGWGTPVVVLATAYGKGVRTAGIDGLRFQDTFNELIRLTEARGHDHPLDSVPTERELTTLREQLGDAAADRIAEEGIGEFMIAAPELLRRLEYGESAEGRAIVRAAIDCRRAGVLGPIPVDWLRTLHRHYLPGPTSEQHFVDGLRWATTPLYKNAALVRRQQLDAEAYAPYDFLVDQQQATIGSPIWNHVIEHAAIEDLNQIGAVAYYSDDLGHAEQAFGRGDQHDDADSAFNLGVLYQARGDFDDAEAAWRRADARGQGESAYNLATLYQDRGDLDDAEAAYRRAAAHGHAGAAFNLGVLLKQRGDSEGAEAAWRRSADRDHPRAVFNLGVLLDSRGDSDGAETAWRHADALGHAGAAHNLGVVLKQRGDLDEAEAAFARARERGFEPSDETTS